MSDCHRGTEQNELNAVFSLHPFDVKIKIIFQFTNVCFTTSCKYESKKLINHISNRYFRPYMLTPTISKVKKIARVPQSLPPTTSGGWPKRQKLFQTSFPQSHRRWLLPPLPQATRRHIRQKILNITKRRQIHQQVQVWPLTQFFLCTFCV